MKSRTKLLIAVGAFLLIIAVFFQGCRGVNVTEQEAIDTAEARIDFSGLEPERTEARVLRQGIPTTSQWIVVFRVQDPDGGLEDFLGHASIGIEISARYFELASVAIPRLEAFKCPDTPNSA